MDDDSKFWTMVWTIAGATILCLAAIIASCSTHQADTIKSMVDKGADPIAASCAVRGADGTGSAAICAIAAGEKTKP